MSTNKRRTYLALAILAGVLGAVLCTAGAMLLSPRIVRAWGPEAGLWTVFLCFLAGMILPSVCIMKIADRIAPAPPKTARRRGLRWPSQEQSHAMDENNEKQ